MPFLWNVLWKLLTRLQSPSPKCRNHFVPKHFIERASLPAFLGRKVKAGMTVEAAVVLPLFLFFFVNLGCAMEMIRLHGNLQLALWNVGNKICIYGYAMDSADEIDAAVSEDSEEKLAEGQEEKDEKDHAWWDKLKDIALTGTYVRNQLVDYVGECYLEASPLSNGVDSLQLWESEIFENKDRVVSGDIVDIIVTYEVSPWMEIPFVRPFRMSNRYYGRLWTGYDVAGNALGDNDAQDVVYITEHASVYHESLDCTHLKLRIREVTLEEAKTARNENGGRYGECAKCKKKLFQDTVFIGMDGDCYHYDRACSGLKRTIYTIPRQQASAYRPCSRCAAVP